MNAFPALGHRPYRWFWGGQILSLIGTWTQNIGQAWLVLQLTNSPLLLGLVSALQFLPMLLFSLYAGVIIDRVSKRHILIVTQTVLMLLALVMAILVSLGAIRFWMFILFASALGLANTVDVPARQSFIIELVGKEHLTNAIALNSAIFNAARLVGPAIAGLILGLWGATWCFLINSLSFVGVILILWFLPKLSPTQEPTRPSSLFLKDSSKPILPAIVEGLRYIRRTPPVLIGIIIIGVVSSIGMNFNVLVPVLAKFELGEEALGYGLLMSSMGFGAMIGALTVAIFSKDGPRIALLVGGAAGLAIFSIVLGLQSGYLASAFSLGLMGWSMICFTASTNSLVQMNSDNEYRGRVMSVYSLVFGGMAPIGSLYAGFFPIY